MPCPLPGTKIVARFLFFRANIKLEFLFHPGQVQRDTFGILVEIREFFSASGTVENIGILPVPGLHIRIGLERKSSNTVRAGETHRRPGRSPGNKGLKEPLRTICKGLSLFQDALHYPCQSRPACHVSLDPFFDVGWPENRALEITSATLNRSLPALDSVAKVNLIFGRIIQQNAIRIAPADYLFKGCVFPDVAVHGGMSFYQDLLSPMVLLSTYSHQNFGIPEERHFTFTLIFHALSRPCVSSTGVVLEIR